jgi:hypothetical protein
MTRNLPHTGRIYGGFAFSVTPFTERPVASMADPFYRLDVSSRYISSA